MGCIGVCVGGDRMGRDGMWWCSWVGVGSG